jgi:hypothetical protein
MTEKKPTGGCMCGAVRYELQNSDTWNVYCHCESCRKHTGAPVSVLVTCTPDQVRWTDGDRALYESSANRHRGFCRDCGSSLTWETEINGHAWLGIHINSLDKPDDFAPIEHVFRGEGHSWFDVDDDLPRYEGSKYIEFGNRLKPRS